MVNVEILVTTEDGQEHNLKLKSWNCGILLAKLMRKMRGLVKQVENNGKKVLSTEVIFKGDWNMLILHQFTKGLDDRGIKWTWEL